jgi:hypothetical protein
MIYVYALLAAGSAAPTTRGEPGLEGCAVELLAERGVVAAISRHATPHVHANVDNLWQHERVIEAMMQTHALLPARFGTIFPDDDRLRRVLLQHHDAIVAGLERVDGCVELGVRVSGRIPTDAPQPVSVPPAETSGRAYMLARAAEERRRRDAEARATELSSTVHEPLMQLARDGVLRPLLTQDLLLSAAYLVERDGVDAFREQIAALVRSHPSVRILCTGPWPPYHFVPPLGPVEGEHG